MNPDDPATAPAAAEESLVSLLAQLHDLREPPAVSMWPATPAWAVLGVAVLAALALGLRLWLRHRRATAYRRAALAALREIEPELRQGRAPALAALEGILRRTALAGFPRADVASLSGPDWAGFLARTGGAALAAHVPALTAATYAPAPPAFDGAGVARAARDWIRRHA